MHPSRRPAGFFLHLTGPLFEARDLRKESTREREKGKHEGESERKVRGRERKESAWEREKGKHEGETDKKSRGRERK